MNRFPRGLYCREEDGYLMVYEKDDTPYMRTPDNKAWRSVIEDYYHAIMPDHIFVPSYKGYLTK